MKFSLYYIYISPHYLSVQLQIFIADSPRIQPQLNTISEFYMFDHWR